MLPVNPDPQPSRAAPVRRASAWQRLAGHCVRLSILTVCLLWGSVCWAQEALRVWAKIPLTGSSRVELIKPAGFVQSATGLSHPGRQVQIQVKESMGAYQQLARGYTASRLSAQGMTLVEKNVILLDGQSGLLVETDTIHGGQHFGKWFLVFGDDEHTVVITATFPKDAQHQSAWVSQFRLALLETRWSS